MLKIIESKFITSATSINEAPITNLPEFVMVGRSNVGKSSFINALCNRKKLAYVGKTPGKTRLINLFQINEDFILTDLPGYGFAQRSPIEQEKWRKKIERYLRNREEIVSIIHLLDARHDIQKNDYQMMEWLKFYDIPSVIILTKIDTLKRGQIVQNINKVQEELNKPVIGFSAKTKQGRNEVIKYISDIITQKALK
ncbi:MAG: ribosome biogenesis GTP-binding protein YihA/YsxC [Vampirovibrionia bacterium]